MLRRGQVSNLSLQYNVIHTENISVVYFVDTYAYLMNIM